MINKEALIEIGNDALNGDVTSQQAIVEALRPLKKDKVEDIAIKIKAHTYLFFDRQYQDADFHLEIDHTFAEQIHGLLNMGVPKYNTIFITGHRECAKTTRILTNSTYLASYMSDVLDYTNVFSESVKASEKTVMDLFNMFAMSNLGKWHDLIEQEKEKGKKEKKPQRKNFFTTKNDVTYSASGVRSSERGAKEADIDESGFITIERPKMNIFDDYENETTIDSIVKTEAIRQVMNAAIDGKDQLVGFDVFSGNYLSLRGNVNYFMNKYSGDPKVKMINIPIYEKSNSQILWPAKYVMTDREQAELAKKDVRRVSIESIKRSSDNFEVEFLNNPRRARVYFNDLVLSKVNEDDLLDDKYRDTDGLLVIEEPTKHDQYAIGVDTAKGLGRDESAFVIYKTTGLIFEEVANFKSNTIAPEQFAPYTTNMAQKYNHAIIIPERNFPGNEFIAFAKPIYNNIFVYDDELDGIPTNLKTKPEMFQKYKKHMLEGLVKVQSKCLYKQMLEFPSEEIDTHNRKDHDGGHYDVLMAAVVGLFKLDRAQAVVDTRMDAAVAKANRGVFKETWGDNL